MSVRVTMLKIYANFAIIEERSQSMSFKEVLCNTNSTL